MFDGSGMSREVHVPFCERLRGRFPWSTHHSQHYILDVVFNEDASRIVMDDAVEHMALFRRFVLNILKQSECGAPSQRNKLKKAGLNDDYRAQLFFG